MFGIVRFSDAAGPTTPDSDRVADDEAVDSTESAAYVVGFSMDRVACKQRHPAIADGAKE